MVDGTTDGFARGIADAGSGVLQWVSDFQEMDEEFSLVRDLTKIMEKYSHSMTVAKMHIFMPPGVDLL